MSHTNFFTSIVKEAYGNKELVKTYNIASGVFLFISLSLVVTFIFVYALTGDRMYGLLAPCILPISYMFDYNKQAKELKRRNE